MTKKVEDLSLYSVKVGERSYVSQVEAASDREAIEKGAARIGADPDKCEVAGKEPVYEETIGLECAESPSESAVFEIRVRGVDEARVEKLANAIYMFIGGPGISDEDYERVHSPEPLERATADVMAFI